MVGHGIVRIELNGPLEFAVSAGPVSIIEILGVGQRDMRFGKGLIDFQRLDSGRLGFGKHLIWRLVSSSLGTSEKIVSVGNTTVGQSEVGILFDRLLKVLK